jgi:hypothetical protein
LVCGFGGFSGFGLGFLGWLGFWLVNLNTEEWRSQRVWFWGLVIFFGFYSLSKRFTNKYLNVV